MEKISTMINAKELRIGNWVTNDCNGELLQVDASDILTASKDPEWLLPIQLTENILESCGFSNKGLRKGCYRIGDFAILKNMDGFVMVDNMLHQHSISMKYLHQLQNAYHTLTQTELTISFNKWEKLQK